MMLDGFFYNLTLNIYGILFKETELTVVCLVKVLLIKLMDYLSI